MQKLYFKLKMGKKGVTRFGKGVFVNDAHLSGIYSDKQLYERRWRETRKELLALQAEVNGFECWAHLAVRDANTAWDTLHTLDVDGLVSEREEHAALEQRLKQVRATEYAMSLKVEASVVALRATERALREARVTNQSETLKTKELGGRLASATNRTDAALARAACAIETVKQIAANCQATQAALNATATNLHLAQTSAGSSEEKVAELEVELASAETRLEQLESQLACEKAKSAPKRGRPAGHRGAEWLSEKWDDCTTDARRVAFWRHCGDIREALTAGGVDDWLPAALASVLDSFDYSSVTRARHS